MLASTSSLSTVSLESSLGNSSAVAEQEMMGETRFLSDLQTEMAGALCRKQDPQDGPKLPAQAWHPWCLGLATEAELYFHSSSLEINLLCGFCLSAGDQAQVLSDRVSSSYFKILDSGRWQH